MKVTLDQIALPGGHVVLVGHLPQHLGLKSEDFEALWGLHPEEFRSIRMHGRWVDLPRWQQAYGRDYQFSGQTSTAMALPSLLQPYVSLAQTCIDDKLNGVLVNWYDGGLGHYIGPHRDKTKQLVPGSPIVGFSLGEQRKMRFRPVGGEGYVDVEQPSAGVLVIPWETNRAWKHEVPKSRKAVGRRVSLTVRAFR